MIGALRWVVETLFRFVFFWLSFFQSLVAVGTHGRAQRWGIYLAVAGGVTCVAALLWFTFLNGFLMVNGDSRWNRFRNADLRASAIALYDAKARYVGIVHPESERDHLGEFDRADLQKFRESPDHKAVQVLEPPEHFWRCVVYSEDRNRGGLFNPYGVDALAMVRIPFSGRGGSTLEMQLARSMWKMHSGNSDRYVRKLQEWQAAPVLNRYLIDGKDDHLLGIWFSQHIPLIQGGGDESGSIYGVYAAGQFLFGKPPDELDIAEQLVLAAAVRSPIEWRGTRAQLANELYDAIGHPDSMRRATRCASDRARLRNGELVIPDAAVREQVNLRLAELRDPDNLVPIDNSFRVPFTPLLRNETIPLLGPMRTAKVLAPNVQREVIAELTDTLTRSALSEAEKANNDVEVSGDHHPWRGSIRELTLTLDLERNWHFRQRVRDTLLDFTDAYSGDSDFRQTALPRRAVDDVGRVRIEVPETAVPLLLVAADETGRVVRYYNSGADTFYSGLSGQRPNIPGYGNGPYDPELEPRGIASVGKMAAALLLADAGETQSNTTINNACMGVLISRCWNTQTPTYPRRVTLRRAFSESLNPPIVRMVAEKVDVPTIDRFMTALNFHLPEAHSERQNVPRSTALTLGRFTGRPKSVHWLAATALAVVRKTPGAVTEPYMVEAFTRLETAEDNRRSVLREVPERQTITVSDYVDTDYPGYVTALLSQPMCQPVYGSLRRLIAWCATSNKTVKLHIAKTGTVSAAGRSGTRFDESDWWIAGGIEFEDGRAYSYVATLGSGAPGHAFAKDMGGGHLAPLVGVLLEDLLEFG